MLIFWAWKVIPSLISLFLLYYQMWRLVRGFVFFLVSLTGSRSSCWILKLSYQRFWEVTGSDIEYYFSISVRSQIPQGLQLEFNAELTGYISIVVNAFLVPLKTQVLLSIYKSQLLGFGTAREYSKVPTQSPISAISYSVLSIQLTGNVVLQ
jgi:hypothetical protein